MTIHQSKAVSGAIALFLLTGAAIAEPVAIRSGLNQGQGWMFARDGRCWVATADHVINEAAGALVSGPAGRNAQSVQITSDGNLDLALLEVQGELAATCPDSSLGDQSSRASIESALRRGSRVLLLRRESGDFGGGVSPVPMDVVGLEDRRPFFTASPAQHERDPLVQSDSGAPIVLQRGGVGEAGLPLGIAFELETFDGSTFVRSLFMDQVRELYENTRAQSLAITGTTQSVSGELIAFNGETQDTACGPLNIMRSDTACGWRVAKAGPAPISISIQLQQPAPDAAQITVRFARGRAASGFAVATRASAGSAWSPEIYCSNSSRAEFATCQVSIRTIDAVKLALEGDEIEILSLLVE